MEVAVCGGIDAAKWIKNQPGKWKLCKRFRTEIHLSQEYAKYAYMVVSRFKIKEIIHSPHGPKILGVMFFSHPGTKLTAEECREQYIEAAPTLGYHCAIDYNVVLAIELPEGVHVNGLHIAVSEYKFTSCKRLRTKGFEQFLMQWDDCPFTLQDIVSKLRGKYRNCSKFVDAFVKDDGSISFLIAH